MRAARLITTFDCPRRCPHCCNGYLRIMSRARTVPSASSLRGFGTVCVTGGEPSLRPDHTLAVVRDIRRACPGAAVYLYTATATDRTPELLDAVDGLQFTLHEGSDAADAEGLERVQGMLEGRSGSYRLYVHPSAEGAARVRRGLWSRIEVKPWLTEDELLAAQPGGLPPGEELLVLESAGRLPRP